MIRPSDVTACLVTRGDQPEMMERIIDSLIFEAVVWDNSYYEDWKCAGRYMAALMFASTPWCFFQDDDVIVPRETQLALCAEHDEDAVLANWGHGDNPDGYDDLPLVGGGAIVHKASFITAMFRYAEKHPLDDDFKYEADFVVGALYDSFRHVHLPFEINLEVAQHPARLCNQPWQKDLKREITDRARAIRDRAMVAA